MKTATKRVHPFAANGRRICRLREAVKSASGRSLSQEALARHVGTTRRHMIRLENGEHLPSKELRDRIAEALNCDPGEIQSADDDEEEADDVPLSREEFGMLGELMSRLGATIVVPADKP